MFKRYLGFILIAFIALIPLFDLFHPGLPLTHDGQDHVARIANFYQSLSEGNIIPRWAGNLNWGYGHPILMFLYPLPSYLSSLFHLLGFSFIDSLKIVFGLTFILSGITMYLWVRNFLGELPAIVSGILYMFAPYRFVDLYVRGAIGEHVAFVFVPVILYFLFKLSKQNFYKYVLGGSLSLAGLILSHNAIAIMFLPFILFYGLYLFYFSKNRKSYFLNLISVIFLGFGLSSFFLLPAFFEGKYTLRDIVTKGEYATRFIQFSDLFSTVWSYGGTNMLSKSIGIIQLITVFGSLLFVRRLFKKHRKNMMLYISLLIYLSVSIFLMVEQSRFIWEVITTLQKFQFPWRFLSVVVFTTAAFGGFLIFNIPRKFQVFTVIGLIVLTIIFNKDYWHAKGYLEKPDEFYNKIYFGTTDTGESSPIWSVRFMEKEPMAHIEIIDGVGMVQELLRTSRNHIYTVTVSDKIRIRENTLYFPGWNVLVDGRKTLVEFQDPKNRGLITFYVDRGVHDVEVKFGETKLRQVSNLISLGSIILLMINGFTNYSYSKIKYQKSKIKN